MVENNKYINRIISFYHTSYIKNPIRFISLIRFLNKNKYNLVIDSSHHYGSSFLKGMVAYLSGGKIRIGFDNGKGVIFTNIHSQRISLLIDNSITLIRRSYSRFTLNPKGNAFLSLYLIKKILEIK